MVTEDYVSFETAKLLKKKGFPQEYDIYHSLVYNEEDYEDEYEIQRMVLETKLVKAGTISSYPVGVPEPKCYCPSQAVVMKWLREVHHIYIDLSPTYSEVEKTIHFIWQIFDSNYDGVGDCEIFYDKYETACEEAIKYCLENLI
jgi:hypothetical protein